MDLDEKKKPYLCGSKKKKKNKSGFSRFQYVLFDIGLGLI